MGSDSIEKMEEKMESDPIPKTESDPICGETDRIRRTVPRNRAFEGFCFFASMESDPTEEMESDP